MSLKKRITLTICSIIVLLMILLSSIIYTKSATILNKEAEKYMLSQLDRARENIDLLIEINRLETEALALNERSINFIENQTDVEIMNNFLVNEMDKKNRNNNYYKDFFILNKDGIIIASCMPEAMNIDLSTREYFIESKKTKNTVTSDILVARSDMSLIVITVSPIVDLRGKVLGHAGIAMKAEYFSNIVNQLELGKKGYYSIIDSNNRILAHQDKSLIGRASTFKLTKEILKKAKKEHPSMVEKGIYENEGIEQLQIYKLMESKNWVLIAVLPEEEVYERSIKLLFYVLLIGTFGIILAILIGIYVSKKISQPIVAIIEYIDKAVIGNSIIEKSISDSIKVFTGGKDYTIAEEIETPTKDEIGNLRKALKKLKDYFVWMTNRFEYESDKLIKRSKALTSTMEDSSLRMAKFISTLSHDLKTSITLIKGYAKGLKSGIIEDEEIKEEFLEGIFSSAVDIEKITCDILDNVYEAKCCPRLHIERIDANEFISILYESTKQYIISSNRVFEGSYESKGGYINIDTTKIKRAWNNLISNAIKYSNEGSRIEVYIREKNKKIEFKVIDEGRGIDEAEVDKIFDMFYRGKDSKKRGYGLGLFIAKSIIDAHGSRLYVSSEEGKGTVFWFYLNQFH